MLSDYGYSEGDHLGKPYDLKLLKRLWPFLRPYRRLLIGSLILVMAITVLDLAIPYFTKVAIDRHIVPLAVEAEGSEGGDESRKRRFLFVDPLDEDVQRIVRQYPHLFEVSADRMRIAFEDLDRLAAEDLTILRWEDLSGLTLVVLLFSVAVLADFLFVFLQKMIMEYTGHKVMHDLRLRLFDHIQQQSMAFFTRQTVARLVTRVTNDVQNMHELFTSFIALVFKDLFLLAGIATVLLVLDWRLALAGFAVLPLVVWAAVRFSNRARDIFRALRIKVGEINTRMSESIEGIRTIQTFCQEAMPFRLFKDREGNPKDRKNTRCYKILSYTDGLFTHPLRGRTRHREIGNAFPKTAGTHHLGTCDQDPAVVHTGTAAQDRRHPHGFTYFP